MATLKYGKYFGSNHKVSIKQQQQQSPAKQAQQSSAVLLCPLL
jgi:hypothetical protein